MLILWIADFKFCPLQSTVSCDCSSQRVFAASVVTNESAYQ